MSNEENHNSGVALRDRIRELMRANEQAQKKQVTEQELRNLKSAASRLDELLQSCADADRQTLSTAARRLDQLLADIRQGKDVILRRRPNREKQT